LGLVSKKCPHFYPKYQRPFVCGSGPNVRSEASWSCPYVPIISRTVFKSTPLMTN